MTDQAWADYIAANRRAADHYHAARLAVVERPAPKTRPVSSSTADAVEAILTDVLERSS